MWILGSGKSLIWQLSCQRLLWNVRGDFHVGRWQRYFYIRHARAKLKIDPLQILDAGCGTGGISFFLAKRFPKARVEEVDVSVQDIETLKKIGH